MNPLDYKAILIKAVMALALFAAGLGGGYKIRDGMAKIAEAAAIKAADDEKKAAQERLNNVSAKYEAERARADRALSARAQTVKEYYRNVPTPGPGCDLPSPMRGLLDGATDSANAAASGQSSGPVPAPAQGPEPGH